MSGGHYGFAYGRLQDITLERCQTDKRRRLMNVLIRLMADALHDIEWVDSGDYGPGDDHKAIDAVLTFLGGDPETKAKALAYDNIVAIVTGKEEE